MALNQSAVNVAVVNGSAGGSVFTQALSVVSATTTSFLKGIATLKTITSTSVVMLIKAISKLFSIVQIK